MSQVIFPVSDVGLQSCAQPSQCLTNMAVTAVLPFSQEVVC